MTDSAPSASPAVAPLNQPSSSRQQSVSPPRPSKRKARRLTGILLSSLHLPSSSDSSDSEDSCAHYVDDAIQNVLLQNSCSDDDGDTDLLAATSAPMLFVSSHRSIRVTSTAIAPPSILHAGRMKTPRKRKRTDTVKPLLAKCSAVMNFSMTVVLDMDETLIYARGDSILLRPHVCEFIHTCHALRCEVIVWTAGSSVYANSVFRAIAKASRMKLWYHHAVTRHPRWFQETGSQENSKDLRLLQRDLRKVLMIENNPASVLCQPENSILVEDYVKANPQDESFVVLKGVLETIVARLSGSSGDAGGGSSRAPRPTVPEILKELPALAHVSVETASQSRLPSYVLQYSPSASLASRQYGSTTPTT